MIDAFWFEDVVFIELYKVIVAGDPSGHRWLTLNPD